MCLKIAREFDRCVEVYKRASEAHVQYGALYHAAKSLENAATACGDNKQYAVAVALLQQACPLYRRGGEPESGAQALEKAGWSPPRFSAHVQQQPAHPRSVSSRFVFVASETAKYCESAKDYVKGVDICLEVVDIRLDEDKPRQCKVCPPPPLCCVV